MFPLVIYGHLEAQVIVGVTRWQSDGTMEKLQSRILGLAQEKGLINWNSGVVDGSISPWQRWR